MKFKNSFIYYSLNYITHCLCFVMIDSNPNDKTIWNQYSCIYKEANANTGFFFLL